MPSVLGGGAAASSNDEDEVATPKDGSPPEACCAGTFCGLLPYVRSAENGPLAFTHHCLICYGGLCGALCGAHYKECKDSIDPSKMSDLLSKFDDPYKRGNDINYINRVVDRY